MSEKHHDKDPRLFFTGDGRRLYYLAAGNLLTFDAATGKRTSIDDIYQGDLLGIGYDDRSGKVVGVRADGYAIHFDPQTGRASDTFWLANPRLAVVRGGVAAVISADRTAIIDAREDKRRPAEDEAAVGVAVTRAGVAVVVREWGAEDHFDLSTTKRLRAGKAAAGWDVYSRHGPGTASPRAAAVARGEQKAGVLDLATGAPVWTAAASVQTGAGGPTFSADGRLVAWVRLEESRNSLEVRDAATGRVRRSWTTAATRRSPVWSADGRLVATFEDNAAWVVREVTGGVERARLKGDGAALAFRPDGKVAAVTTAAGVALVPLVGDGETVTLLLPETNIGLLAYSPDGRTLATAAGPDAATPSRHRVHLWDRDGRRSATFRSDEGRILSMCIAPDGRTQLTGTDSGTCLVWRVPAESPTGLDTPTWADPADDAKAAKAVAKLAAGGDASVTLLEAHLTPAVAPAAARVATLIDALDADSAETRWAAEAGLRATGEAALPALAAARAKSAEQRRAVARLVAVIDRQALVDVSRESRAVEVLEKIGTPRARALLKKLAAGAPGRLTREAEEALSRLR